MQNKGIQVGALRANSATLQSAVFFLAAFNLSGNVCAELISSETTYSIYPTHKSLRARYRYEDEAKEACHRFTASYGYTAETYCGRAMSKDEPIWQAGWLREGNTDNFGLGTFIYCTSYQRYFPDVGKCVGVTQLPDALGDPGNNGGQCASDPRKKQPCLFDPINPGTGNMWKSEVDYRSAAANGLYLSRTYNSNPFNIDAAAVRSFGARWTQSFDVKLKPEAAQPGGIQGTCWRRNDNGQVWCESPSLTDNAIPDAVSVVRGDGKKDLFNRSGKNWIAKADINSRLTATYDADASAVIEWEYVSEQGDRTERFDSDGRLTAITLRNGFVQRLTYSDGKTNDTTEGRLPADAPACSAPHAGDLLPAGRLLCVTDGWGRQLRFEYDAYGRVAKLIDPGNLETIYAYDGPSGGCVAPGLENTACSAHNLTQVTYPDGSRKTYYYNESSLINGGSACTGTSAAGNGFGHLIHSMTGMVDENGVRHVSWTYDCAGSATSTYLAGGVNKATVAYGKTSGGVTNNTVTHYMGTDSAPQLSTTWYAYQTVLGVARNTGMGKVCVECGTTGSRQYDDNGNVTRAADWNNNYTCYDYDLARNLETVRVEGSSSSSCEALLSAASLAAPVRKTSTEWHPQYRLPARVAEPGKLTTYGYDVKGNLLTRDEQPTLDATGVQGFAATLTGTSRTWTYSYNGSGQVLTAKGPRTDIDDTTTYAYDAQGNLTSITNPAGQVTTLSEYDANGRVGRIVDANGLVADLTYSPRGWLTSRKVGNETTFYDYDAAGQLTKLTLPDGSYVSHTYDDAHRLTGTSDSEGNSIAYTLDNMGNRIKMEVKDPDGTLAQQLTRAYDSLNRLQQVTGGMQ